MSDEPNSTLRQKTKHIGPFRAVAIVLLPAALIEPLKVVGICVAGKGHWLIGAGVVAIAFAAGFFVVERLFRILKPNMLRAPVLAKAWRRFVAVREATYRTWRQIIPSGG